MTKIEIKYNPKLTKEKLMDIFSKYFNDKYEIYPTKLLGVDFFVKKSAVSGVVVGLKQKQGKTLIKLQRLSPSLLVRFIGWLPTMIFAGRGVMNDVKEFLNTEQEFK